MTSKSPVSGLQGSWLILKGKEAGGPEAAPSLPISEQNTLLYSELKHCYFLCSPYKNVGVDTELFF